ncbi:Zinc finger protein [Plakobranchus ocellatus]|uniref:Zinc finger protein n=1 Tax=Plakobranchus ocellatus TaxID=259542 RepID=A0AAV4C8Y3_9GAST|nr:Zinc finger protein [Plakobranchus ocellatus]
MDSVPLRESEKRVCGGQRAWEDETSTDNQRSCFKWIAREELDDNAVINLRTPYLCGEVKALCIPDAICDVTVRKGEGARGPEDHDGTVMVACAEAVPLRKIDAETVAESLVGIYSRLGVPGVVLSDQETQFKSDCMKATIGENDYHINVNGKEKTSHDNLVKRYIIRGAVSHEATIGDNFVSAASAAVVEDDDESSGCDDYGYEVIPEHGGWGSYNR